MCIFGNRKLRKQLEQAKAEIERLRAELAKTPARGADGRYVSRKK